MKRRSHIERQTAREMAEGKRQGRKNAKEAKGHAKARGKSPVMPAEERQHYTLPPIDPNLVMPKQVRKAGRVAQSYYEPDGPDAKLVRLEKQLALVRKTVEDMW